MPSLLSRRRTRPLTCLVAGLALLLLVAACGEDAAAPDDPDPAPPAGGETPDDGETPGDPAADGTPDGDGEFDEVLQIRFGGSTPLVWPHAWIANELGLWEQYGLEATTDQFVLGTEALQAMLAGATDLAPLTALPTLTAAAGGEDVRMFGCTTTWSHWRLVVRDDAGIESIDDLPGHSIATAVGTNMEFILRDFLQQNDVDADDIEFVNVRPPDIPSAIQTGSVDAVWAPPPSIVHAERGLDGAFTTLDYDFDAVYCLVTTQELLDEKREEFRRLLAMFADIDDMIESDPEGIAAQIAEVAQAEPELISSLWSEEFVFNTEPPGDAVLEEMELYWPYLQESGDVRADAEVDFQELLVTDVMD